ncbi:MAG TPA: hypothetical protein VKB84_00870 [Candidatus Binataceae bacterium]|nr:hypothetical protein [Candidatus Binataceae bacterium]
MKRKYIFSLAAAAVGSVALAAAAVHAEGFGHHGRHHGSGAVRACIAVMNPTQRANLKTIFTPDEKSTLKGDYEAVKGARNALNLAILGGTTDLSKQEGDLSAAQSKLLADQDKLAVKICGSIGQPQLGSADTLYKNLAALRESTHEKAHEILKEAHAAAME